MLRSLAGGCLSVSNGLIGFRVSWCAAGVGRGMGGCLITCFECFLRCCDYMVETVDCRAETFLDVTDALRC